MKAGRFRQRAFIGACERIVASGSQGIYTVLNAALRIQNMIRAREPGTFFGGGVIAGLLAFLVWFALVPSNRKAPTDASSQSAASGQVQGPIGANGEVLSAITGTDGIGGNSFGRADATNGLGQESTLGGVEDGDVPFTGQFGETVPGGSDVVDGSEPTQEGFLEAYAEIDGVRVPDMGAAPVAEVVLRPWYVEIARNDGQVEVLQVNAQSSEHALSIVRDYRGNPEVLRGPATQPLR